MQTYSKQAYVKDGKLVGFHDEGSDVPADVTLVNVRWEHEMLYGAEGEAVVDAEGVLIKLNADTYESACAQARENAKRTSDAEFKRREREGFDIGDGVFVPFTPHDIKELSAVENTLRAAAQAVDDPTKLVDYFDASNGQEFPVTLEGIERLKPAFAMAVLENKAARKAQYEKLLSELDAIQAHWEQ